MSLALGLGLTVLGVAIVAAVVILTKKGVKAKAGVSVDVASTVVSAETAVKNVVDQATATVSTVINDVTKI